MICLIYITLLFFLIIDIVLDNKILTPIKIFNFIWIILLGLYYLNLSYIQTNFLFKTLFIFWICVFCFDLSYIICSKFLFFKAKKNVSDKKIELSSTVNKKLKICNIAFIILFVIEILYTRKLPLVSTMMGKDSDYLSFGITSLHGLLNTIAMCLGTYYLFKKDKRKYIYIYIICIINLVTSGADNYGN